MHVNIPDKLLEKPDGIFDFASSNLMLIFVGIIILAAVYIQFKAVVETFSQKGRSGGEPKDNNDKKDEAAQPTNESSGGQTDGV